MTDPRGFGGGPLKGAIEGTVSQSVSQSVCLSVSLSSVSLSSVSQQSVCRSVSSLSSVSQSVCLSVCPTCHDDQIAFPEPTRPLVSTYSITVTLVGDHKDGCRLVQLFENGNIESISYCAVTYQYHE